MLATKKWGEIAQAELTKDMVERLLERFDSLATSDGTIKVQFRDNVLWMLPPGSSPELVGIASLPTALKYLK
ncbi:hypothetical protein [Paracoccus sp. 1_MG-2023]|uniref:hypothetical protein n=1 Tax=Paracoccus sp. 1_MG-2023 TaxID=3062651 RepID=UPI0026E3D213|nr:hypothetical protein [Paracoccus sp. 1_MG-2023]